MFELVYHILEAIAQTKLESKPPLNKKPTLASASSRL